MIIEEVDEIMDDDEEESLKEFSVLIIKYIWNNILLRTSDFTIEAKLKPEEKKLYVLLEGSFNKTSRSTGIKTTFDIKTNKKEEYTEYEMVQELVKTILLEYDIAGANCDMERINDSKIHLKGWNI